MRTVFFALIGVALTATVMGLAVPGGVAVAQTASDKYPVPDPYESYNQPIPDSSLEDARELFRGNLITRANPTEAREDVRLFVLHESPAWVRKNRAYALANGWEPAFIKVVDEMVSWVEDLRRGDPRRPYELAKQYEADTKDPYGKHVAFYLRYLAMDMGHPEAIFELAMQYIDDDDGLDRRLAQDRLRDAGDRNYRPALKELIDRHLEARGFRPDPGVAYYWLKRAEAAGMDVAAEIAILEPTLSAADRKRAKDWLASGKYPESWDY